MAYGKRMSKYTVLVLEMAARILKEKKEELANRDIRISVSELPKEELLREIKLLAGQLELKWESYRRSIGRCRPKAA